MKKIGMVRLHAAAEQVGYQCAPFDGTRAAAGTLLGISVHYAAGPETVALPAPQPLLRIRELAAAGIVPPASLTETRTDHTPGRR